MPSWHATTCCDDLPVSTTVCATGSGQVRVDPNPIEQTNKQTRNRTTKHNRTVYLWPTHISSKNANEGNGGIGGPRWNQARGRAHTHTWVRLYESLPAMYCREPAARTRIDPSHACSRHHCTTSTGNPNSTSYQIKSHQLAHGAPCRVWPAFTLYCGELELYLQRRVTRRRRTKQGHPRIINAHQRNCHDLPTHETVCILTD